MKQILTVPLKIIVNFDEAELLGAESCANWERLNSTSAIDKNEKIRSSPRWRKSIDDRQRTNANEQSARAFKVSLQVVVAPDTGLATKVLQNRDRLKELSVKAATATMTTEGLFFHDSNDGFKVHAKLASARSICQDGIGIGYISSIPDLWETETTANAERVASAQRPDKVLSSFGGVQTQSPTKL